jgi:DedD protein
MREGAKQRLVGVAVIVALAVIFVPMLFEEAPLERAQTEPGAIPKAPPFEPDLKSEVFLGPGESGVGGFDPAAMTESKALPLPPPGDRDAASVAGVSVEGMDEAEPEPEPEPHPAAGSGRASAPPSASVLEPAPPRGARDGMPSWVVQVASLGSPEAAQAMQDKLRKAGFSAFVEQADVRGKRFYRVRVGPEVDRANAERTASRLREQQKLDTLIQNYP